jgi:hypothetical protein
MLQRGWLEAAAERAYALTTAGEAALAELGISAEKARTSRRRFACSCLDWSERRPHLGGALGAELLALLLTDGWLERDLDSRALAVTRAGKRRFKQVFALDVSA